MSRLVPTEQFLCDWQNQIMDTAKMNLRRDGHVQPYVFILNYPELVPQDFRSRVKTMNPADSPLFAGADLVVMVLPLSYATSEIYRIINEVILGEAGRARTEVLERAAKHVRGMTEAKVQETVVKAFLEARGWVEADLIALHIRETLKASRAISYVKVATAGRWSRSTTTTRTATASRGPRISRRVRTLTNTGGVDDEK